MILIWNGLGCLVIPLCIIGGVAAAAIGEFAPNDNWLQLLAVLGTAAATFGLGVILNRPQAVGRDPWGNVVTATENHSLYWIPVQYWAPIILVVGTILVFKK